MFKFLIKLKCIVNGHNWCRSGTKSGMYFNTDTNQFKDYSQKLYVCRVCKTTKLEHG